MFLALWIFGFSSAAAAGLIEEGVGGATNLTKEGVGDTNTSSIKSSYWPLVPVNQ